MEALELGWEAWGPGWSCFIRGPGPSPEPAAKQTWLKRNVLATGYGVFAVAAPHYPFLAAARMEICCTTGCPAPCSAPLFRPLWEPQKSGTWCPGNMMSAHTALVSVLNYPLK